MGAFRAKLIIVLFGAIFGCWTGVSEAHPHGADCMKNPFATGCRGISAKRSAPSPLELGEQLYRLLGPAPDRTQRAERAGPQQPAQWQDLSALELLLEAAGRLGPIEQQQQQRRRLASRLGHNFGQLDEGLAQNLWRAGSPLAPTHKDAAELVK